LKIIYFFESLTSEFTELVSMTFFIFFYIFFIFTYMHVYDVKIKSHT